MIRKTFILIAGLVGLSFGPQQVAYEQIATDYFFEHYFKKEYSDIKVIEFNKQTDGDTNYGVVFQCADWEIDLKQQIVSASLNPNREIDISLTGLKIKPKRGRSYRLKLNVSPAVEVDHRKFVFISVYKRLHFVNYYIIELNNEGGIVGSCTTEEII